MSSSTGAPPPSTLRPTATPSLARARVAVACAAAACAAVACAAPDVPPPTSPKPIPDAAVSVMEIDAPNEQSTGVASDASAPDAAEIVATVADSAPPQPEVWLKGSTHVHARPSGDSTTPLPDVIAWYEANRYDFIVLTDHNRTTETQQGASLMVIPGIELTHNPSNCIPPGDKSGKCRIHVNLLGVTGKVDGKLVWANRKTQERLPKYEAALEVQKQLGGVPQINHPNWFWGMNGDLLAELARRGFRLVEIANAAFEKWNQGDKDHPSLDALWDQALVQGVTLWGIASDDAHDYEPSNSPTKYPAGGGWVVVKAQRTPQAILAALAAGRFYASNGVVLHRAEVDGDALVVEVAAGQRGSYLIDFIENGKRVERVKARSARRTLPATGYLRALVTRGDGTKAWVQPARR